MKPELTRPLPTRFLPIVAALAIAGFTTHAQPSDDAHEATRMLHSLLEREWDAAMERHPTRASSLGDRRWNDRWPDMRPEAFAQWQRHLREVRARLNHIDRVNLSDADQLNFDLFKKDLEVRIREHQYGWHRIPLNQRGGLQTEDELADSLRFDSVQDYEDWIARMRAFPEYMRQTVSLMREGMATGMLLPRIIMRRVPNQISKQVVTQPEDSPFYKPFRQWSDKIPPDDRDRLDASARAAIRNDVVPAFEHFAAFFSDEYLPACHAEVGAWQMPEGGEMYAFFARKFTTTDLTPEAIHKIGMEEVARIRSHMESVRSEVGFNGTLGEFFEHLRTDPRYYYPSPQSLLEAYRAMSKRIDPAMVTLFKTLPRMPYGVEPIPDKIAPDTTTAYYRPPAADGSRAGSYFVNLYKPEVRPTYEMMALSLHEAVPGHHLQIALAMELGELPHFRRFGGYTAFIEGWGLYAEHLGEELGLYDDPYSKFGQLTYEMWRAIRLVVDTGMHHMRWPRDKAIRFFKDNAAKSEQDIVNEIDRYIAWPGQALAYKIGELKIKELRRRAEQALGERFDVREFHDAVLLSGAVPLDILEQRIDRWIEGESKGP